MINEGGVVDLEEESCDPEEARIPRYGLLQLDQTTSENLILN